MPDDAMTLDHLTGDPRQTGQGIGTAVIRSVIVRTWAAHPAAPCVLVLVVAANRPSWRALEGAELRRVATGDLEPDNPLDAPVHYLYRVDRQVTGD